MNPDRDALEGLVNKNDVGRAEGLPSVSPHLVDYLKSAFTDVPFDATQVPRGVSLAEGALWEAGVAKGVALVLDHLERLAEIKGVKHNEPAQAESASTDPRRPGTDRRG